MHVPLHAAPATIQQYVEALPRSSDSRSGQLMLQTQVMFHLAGAAKQPSTWRQYEPVWQKWEAFCQKFGLHADKSDPRTARLFLSEQIEEARAAPKPKGPGVIEQSSAGLTAYFTARGLPSPCTEDFFSLSQSLFCQRHANTMPMLPFTVAELAGCWYDIGCGWL